MNIAPISSSPGDSVVDVSCPQVSHQVSQRAPKRCSTRCGETDGAERKPSQDPLGTECGPVFPSAHWASLVFIHIILSLTLLTYAHLVDSAFIEICVLSTRSRFMAAEIYRYLLPHKHF